MSLGEIIKSARLKANMTQTELGEAIGVSGVAIMRYEKGEREPKLAILLKIAEILNINPMEFMHDKERQAAEELARAWVLSDDPQALEKERSEWAKIFLRPITPNEKVKNDISSQFANYAISHSEYVRNFFLKFSDEELIDYCSHQLHELTKEGIIEVTLRIEEMKSTSKYGKLESLLQNNSKN